MRHVRACAILILAALASSAFAAPSAPTHLHWDSWAAGYWHSGGCDLAVTPDVLTITYTVGAKPDVWPNAERVFNPVFDMSRFADLAFDVRMTPRRQRAGASSSRMSAPRPNVPVLGLSLLLGTPQGAHWQLDSLPTRLRVGQWVHESIDLFQVPPELLAHLGRFQFFMWNRDFQKAGYRAGDKIVFEVRNLALTGTRDVMSTSIFGAAPLQHVLADTSRAAVWSEPPDTKVLPETGLPKRVAKERGVVRLAGAANSYVAFQVAIRAKQTLSHVKVTVSFPALTSARPTPKPYPIDVISVRPEGFVTTKTASGYAPRPGRWPDPLLMPGALDVPSGESRAFWVRLFLPASMGKGAYAGTLAVTSSAGTLARAKIALSVYGFALSDESHLPTAFQFSVDKGWSHFLDYYPNAGFAIFKRFWQSMAQHRLDPMHIGPSGPPKQVTPATMAHFARYVDLAEKLKFSHFLSFFWGPPVDTGAERAWTHRVTDWWVERGLLDKTFVYMCQFDEAGPARWPDLIKYAKLLKATDPRLLRMATLAPSPELYGSVDVWCPKTNAYNPTLAARRRKLGEKVWWYTCGTLMPGLLIDRPGYEPRALIWLTWTEHADGLLYWCVDYWPKNPWQDPQMGPGTSGNGDGFFLYPRRPGDPPDRLYESIRWEMLLQSMQDYEYFWTLRHRLHAAVAGGKVRPAAIARARAALGLIGKVAAGIHTYSRAPEDYAYVRHEVALAIEALPVAR